MSRSRLHLTKNGSGLRGAASGLLIALLLAFSPQAFPVHLGTANASSASVPSQYPDQGLSVLAANDRVTLGILNSMAGGKQDVASYASVIQDQFLSFGVRKVLLDIGWQNHTIGSIAQDRWVDNWLSASDQMGLQNVLYAGQFTQGGIGSPWVESLLKSDPGTRTYDSKGLPANYVSLDNPEVAIKTEKDLSLIYSYYGRHPSWVGLGTGATSSDPYFGTNSTMPTLGYANSSVAAFSNSQFYARDVNKTGYLPGGTLDALWQSLRQVNPSILMSSGDWQTSTPEAVYGNGTNRHEVAMRFFVPRSEAQIRLQWYGDVVGSPGLLVARVFNDNHGALASGTELTNATQSSASLSTNSTWEPPITVTGNFSRNFFWVVFSSPNSNSLNYYEIVMRDYEVQGASASYILSGPNHISGSSTLWVKDRSGADLSVYPHQYAIGPQETQPFYAATSFSFNTVFIFLSDRHYDPTNATLQITDQTEGGTQVATGGLSQKYTHGLQIWTPVPLDTTVTTKAGHNYLMVLSEKGISWGVVLRGIHSDPPSGGFQNQTAYWLFQLGYLDWSQRHWDYSLMGPNGNDAVRQGVGAAVEFAVPSGSGQNSSLSQVSVLMQTSAATAPYYPADSKMSVSISANDPARTVPTGQPLATVVVPGSKIPQNGWLNVTGLNAPVTPGLSYWVLFSTNSNVTFPMARLTNSYNFHSLTSRDGGRSWVGPGEGPTDFAFAAVFSNGVRIDNIDGIRTIVLGDSITFAQPFIAQKSTQADGVFLGTIKANRPSDNFVTVSINQDNGTGGPSAYRLASGKLFAANVTLGYGLVFVQFTSVARLKAGAQYWIVVTPGRGTFSVLPVIYPHPQPDVAEKITAMTSNDSGYNWSKVASGKELAILSYAIGTSSLTLPTYDTKAIYSTLSRYHDFNATNYPPSGWSAYVLSSELQTFRQVTDWLNTNLGSQFRFYGSFDPSVLTVLKYQDIVSLRPIGAYSTCQQLVDNLLAAVPQQDQQLKNLGDFALLRQCGSSDLQTLVPQLNYMLYPGPRFGAGRGTDVLIVGDGSSSNLPRYLSPALNVTYVQLGTDPTLRSRGNLSSYRAVVWLSKANATAPETRAAVQGYVRNGGNLVVAEAPPSWTSSLVVTTGASQSNQTGSKAKDVFGLWTAHTTYSVGLNVRVLSNTSAEAFGPAVTLGMNGYGSGRVMLMEPAGVDLESAPQSSDALILLSNTISSAALGGRNAGPFWYGTNQRQDASGLLYSVQGTKGGPILVWISNPASAPGTLSLHLNGSFYGISTSWRTFDLANLAVTSGNGSDVAIGITVQPGTWHPVYILPDSNDTVVGYSSVVVARHLVFPNQTLSSLQGFDNQSGVVAIWSGSPIQNILLNDKVNLTRLATSGDLMKAQSGWFYDGASKTLTVKYRSSVIDSLRVLKVLAPPVPPVVLPMRDTELVLRILVGVDVALFVFAVGYARLRSRSAGKKESLGAELA